MTSFAEFTTATNGREARGHERHRLADLGEVAHHLGEVIAGNAELGRQQRNRRDDHRPHAGEKCAGVEDGERAGERVQHFQFVQLLVTMPPVGRRCCRYARIFTRLR